MARPVAVRLLAVVALLAPLPAAADPVPRAWQREFPKTDFDRAIVPLAEITSGGPPRDGIPSIDDPSFAPAAASDLPGRVPVIGFAIGGDARAYPLHVLHWHEIVNDTVGGVPVAVTYCPLCNAAVVFDRRLHAGERDGPVLEFGTTGKLRHSDLVMYDRTTETWWQQFTGRGIVGDLAGFTLTTVPARLESLAAFRGRHPDGRILVPNDPDARDYGRNPYVGYDGAAEPFLYRGEVPAGVAPMARVVAVGDDAWSLDLLRDETRLTEGDLVLGWAPGQASALDGARVAEGRDVGSVVVERRRPDGTTAPVTHTVPFAFAFFAFHPDGVLRTADGRVSW